MEKEFCRNGHCKSDENTDSRGRCKECIRAYNKKRVADLSDSYIKRLICRGSDLSAKDIPDYLVELKREAMLNKRLLKQFNKELKEYEEKETENRES